MTEASPVSIGSWIAFDLEWELVSDPLSGGKTVIIESLHPYATSEPPETEGYHRITTFAYEDNYGNKMVIDIANFVSCENLRQELLLAIKNKLLLYDYCFGWGSKAVKYKNEKTGNLEGIDGDLFVLDTNFKLSGIDSIIRYDKFTGIPYIKSSNYGSSSITDIDLLRVFTKPHSGMVRIWITHHYSC